MVKDTILRDHLKKVDFLWTKFYIYCSLTSYVHIFSTHHALWLSSFRYFAVQSFFLYRSIHIEILRKYNSQLNSNRPHQSPEFNLASFSEMAVRFKWMYVGTPLLVETVIIASKALLRPCNIKFSLWSGKEGEEMMRERWWTLVMKAAVGAESMAGIRHYRTCSRDQTADLFEWVCERYTEKEETGHLKYSSG